MSISHQIMSLGGGAGGGGSTPVTSLTYTGHSGNRVSGTNTITITWPTGTAEGDLLVTTVWVDNATPTFTTPTDWTLLGNGNTGEYPKAYTYAKLMTAADITAGSQDFVCNNASYGLTGIALTLTPDGTISSFTARNYINAKGPSALSINIANTDVVAPTAAIAMLTGRPSQSPVMSFSGSTIQTDTTGGGTRSVGYILYDSTGTPSSHSASSSDTGRQSMSGFYIDVA